MNWQWSSWKRAVSAAGICLLLTGCGGGGDVSMDTYDIGENSVPSLDTCLVEEEGGSLLSASPTKEEMQKLLEQRQKAAENAAKEAEKEAKKAAKEASKEAKKALKEAEKAAKAAEKDAKRAVKEFGEGSPEAQTAAAAVDAAAAEVQQLSAALPEEEEKDDKKDKDEEDSKEQDSEDAQEGEDAKADEQPEDGKDTKDDKKSEDGEEEETITFTEAYTYTYENVPAAAMERYAELLTGENGFKTIDMERMPLEEMPDFSTDSGYVIFAKNGAEEGTIFVLDISWMDGIQTVVVRCPHGTIKRPPSAETNGGAGGMGAMTLGDMVSYVSSLQPADLGLPGASMSEYTVIPVEGNPMVDGQVCRHVNVYKEDANTGTNTFQGSYLIGGNSIYRKNAGDNTVEKIR